jgi:lipid A ethanolaminephosphotransferase
VINFSQVSSCGTSTAVSVPCMFSVYDKDNYTHEKGEFTQNLMDILNLAGVNTLWRDNNANWQEIARKTTYQNFKSSKNNPVCDIECRDIGMLNGLQEYINKSKNDVFIVLRQMGNHGPAYYKRYPKEFEKFTPVCKTNQLEECSANEIGNAYDNAILYTDYFLSKVINLLKQNDDLETAMIYLSDHGESLGENGLYLHGLPYFIAPKEQTHIPMIMWFSKTLQQSIDTKKIKQKQNEKYSQDNIFHTILGIINIKTKIYNKKQDILSE